VQGGVAFPADAEAAEVVQPGERPPHHPAHAAESGVWANGTLQLKLALVALVAALVVWHMGRPTMHALEAGVFVISLAIVWLGLTLAHRSG
jgi:hypothetical protein